MKTYEVYLNDGNIKLYDANNFYALMCYLIDCNFVAEIREIKERRNLK